MSRVKWIVVVVTGLILCAACSQGRQPLPYLGPLQVEGTDTSYYKIPDFTVIDQDSQIVSSETLAGDIFVADFFFTTCPTICPKMTKQMNRVYERYGDNEHVQLISFTIDTRHDTVPVLKAYANKMDIPDGASWHFVWGPRDEIYDLAKAYFQTAYPDSTIAGGFVHSGQFALVDGDGHIRGFFNGTDPGEVDKLMTHMEILLDAREE